MASIRRTPSLCVASTEDRQKMPVLLQDCIRKSFHVRAINRGLGTHRERRNSIARKERRLPSRLHGAKDVPWMRGDQQQFRRLCAEMHRGAAIDFQVWLETADGAQRKKFVKIFGEGCVLEMRLYSGRTGIFQSNHAATGGAEALQAFRQIGMRGQNEDALQEF